MKCMVREGVSPIVSVDLARVMSVYSGKMNHCCCGCSGRYSHSSKAEELGEKMQDYYDINDRSVLIITNKVKKLLDNPEAELIMNEKGLGCEWIVSIDLATGRDRHGRYTGRTYILYMKAKATALVSSSAAYATSCKAG